MERILTQFSQAKIGYFSLKKKTNKNWVFFFENICGVKHQASKQTRETWKKKKRHQ
jgi:hypothetical protein